MNYSAFYFYFSICVDGYLSRVEKKRIMHLSALVNDCAESEEAFWNIVQQLEEDEVNDVASCQEFKILSRICEGRYAEQITAVDALFEVCTHLRERTPYLNRNQWIRKVFEGYDRVAKAFLQYSFGALKQSIELFEEIKGEDTNYPIMEILAVLNYEAENYEKALEYSIRARTVDGKQLLRSSTMENIEEISKNMIGCDKCGDIYAKAIQKRKENKIGFQ